MIYKVFEHKSIPDLHCMILAETRRGYKIRQVTIAKGRRKEKGIIRYCEKWVFDPEGGAWKPSDLQIEKGKLKAEVKKVAADYLKWSQLWREQHATPDFKMKDRKLYAQQLREYNKLFRKDSEAYLSKKKEEMNLSWFDIDPLMIHE